MGISLYSTVSYNTEPYLRTVLDTLREENKIMEWAYIKHLADEDDKKEHFHVLFYCWKAYREKDLISLKSAFNEFDPQMPEHPRTILPVCPTRGDGVHTWWLYATHKEEYLKMKNLVRNIHYSEEEIKCSDAYLKDDCLFKANEWLRIRNKKVEMVLDPTVSSAELYHAGYCNLNEMHGREIALKSCLASSRQHNVVKEYDEKQWDKKMAEYEKEIKE